MTGRPRSMYGRRKQRPLPKTHFEKGVVMVQRRVRRWTASLVVVLLGVLLWPAPSRAWPTDATTFSGQATGVRATVLGITAVLADTGPLPPSGSVIVNEQEGSTSGATGEMTVNALHVTLTGVADIVIASAHADVGCAQNVCDPSKEFVTGGGWITGPSGAKANFAVAGGKEPGWGHLIYSEHGSAALRVKATAITGYTNLGGTVRRVEGTADVNGQPGTFQADVADNA